MPPVASVRSGNAQPEPMKSSLLRHHITRSARWSTVGVITPGVTQHVHDDDAVAAGCPPMSTVRLPLTIVPDLCHGQHVRIGREQADMRWGVHARATDDGRGLAGDQHGRADTDRDRAPLNGSGGDGCGIPVAGLGMMWIGHCPVIWSPITIGRRSHVSSA